MCQYLDQNDKVVGHRKSSENDVYLLPMASGLHAIHCTYMSALSLSAS